MFTFTGPTVKNRIEKVKPVMYSKAMPQSNVKPRRNNMKRLLKSHAKQQHEAKETNVTNWTQHTHVYQRCKRTKVAFSEQSALQGTGVRAISAHRNCAA